jgi:hypothetical protein
MGTMTATPKPAPMTDARIQELRDLLAKATPGPWRAGCDDDSRCGRVYAVMSGYDQVACSSCNDDYCHQMLQEDEDLIVALRNAAPDLLHEIERLRAALQELLKNSDYAGTQARIQQAHICRAALGDRP